MFADPYRLDPGRRPNRHISFGTGPHRCVGRQLARMVMKEAVTVLSATIDRIEPAGPKVHLASNLVAGLVRLPLRVTTR